MHSPKFNNKVIVITGAGSGIGRALAVHFAEQGASLALNSRTKGNLDETVSLVQAKSKKVFSRCFDIANKEEVFAFANEVQREFGEIDILINNAGVAIGGLTFEELDLEDFEWIFSINYMGTLYATKAFLPLLKENKNGSSLVNISSLFGLVPMALKTPYASTKYAITGFTNSLRMELDNTPVKVIGVYPGGVKTGVTLNAHKADQEPEYAEAFNKMLKMEPDAAANIIVQGIQKGKENIIVGRDAKMAIFIYRHLPSLINKMAKKTMAAFKS